MPLPALSRLIAAALAAGLLSACGEDPPPSPEAALKSWVPPSIPYTPAPAPAAEATQEPEKPAPVRTFEVAEAEPASAPAPRPPAAEPPMPLPAAPTPVLSASTKKAELPRTDTCAALPMLQELGGDVQWVEVSDYSAGVQDGARFLPNGAHPVRLAKVRVSTPGKVALLVGAYEPNIWQIETAPGSQVVGVWASGYHEQRVTGVPLATPVVLTSYEGKGGCGTAYSQLAQAYQRHLGTKTVSRADIKNGVAYIGTLANVYRPDAKSPVPAEFYAKDTRLPQQYGLDQLVQQGALRPATHSEMAQVPLPVAERAYQTYVVLKALELPRGLYGANGGGSLFLVPPGTPAPTGDLGHARMFDLQTKTCKAADGPC